MKTPAPRQLLVFGGLAVSLGLTVWVSLDEAPVTVAAAPRRGSAAPAPAASASPSDWPGPAALGRADWPELDAQARTAWGDAPPVAVKPPPPPPEPPANEEPPPPVAPPFPYQLVGRITDGTPRAVLNNAQRSAVVGAGDVVDGAWRVEAVEAGGLRLTYIPLGLAQFVPFASPAA